MAAVNRYKDPEEVAENLAVYISQHIQVLAQSTLKITLLLSGGTTPKMLYEKLAQDTAIPWERIHIFWSDERFVPMDSDESNFKMAHDVLLSKISIPSGNIHPIKTDFSSKETAAQAYQNVLRSFFGGELPVWDINILGIGEDCHTASLFPNSTILHEKEKWVIGVDRQKPPPQGITMTLPILNNSKYTCMLVTGENKAQALKNIFNSDMSVDECPAKGIRSVNGELTWWVDMNAARLV